MGRTRWRWRREEGVKTLKERQRVRVPSFFFFSFFKLIINALSIRNSRVTDINRGTNRIFHGYRG